MEIAIDTGGKPVFTSTMQSGAEQLKDWMLRRRFLQREAAEYLGWDETYVSQLITGSRVPGLDNAIHIERLTGVPVEAWASRELDRVNRAEEARVAKRKLAKA